MYFEVLGKDSRAFQEVFDTAQRILRKTFGLELVPLRGKGKGAGGNGDVAEDDEPEQSASASRKKKKKIRGSDDGAEDEGEDDVATTMRQRRKGSQVAILRCTNDCAPYSSCSMCDQLLTIILAMSCVFSHHHERH